MSQMIPTITLVDAKRTAVRYHGKRSGLSTPTVRFTNRLALAIVYSVALLRPRTGKTIREGYSLL